MRVVIQRVSKALLEIENRHPVAIGKGLVVLLGIEDADNTDDIDWLIGKIVRLRIFDDHEGVMNVSVKEVSGDILVVSQFTLHASTKKGNRPSYIKAARPETAIPLYDLFVDNIRKELGKEVKTGVFGAMMDVSLTNSGPVTIIIDSKNKE